MQRIHVIRERDAMGHLHSCSYIRLQQPLTHPTIAQDVSVTFEDEQEPDTIDAAIIERLVFEQKFGMQDALTMLAHFEKRDVPIIYTIDDNLLDLNRDPGIWHFPTEEQRAVLRLFATRASGIIVSTDELADRLSGLNNNIVVVPNQIDERHFTQPPARQAGDKVEIGYMGSATHLQDVLMILQPLREFLYDNRDTVELELVGVASANHIQGMFGDLPVKHTLVPKAYAPYPKFAGWMLENVQWDFAIAPLARNSFSDCKSDLKILDYGILGIPGIFSDVPSYHSTIRHGENGMLAANEPQAWRDTLQTLTDDAGLRAKLSDAISDEVWSNRTLAQQAKRWVEAVETIIKAA